MKFISSQRIAATFKNDIKNTIVWFLIKITHIIVILISILKYAMPFNCWCACVRVCCACVCTCVRRACVHLFAPVCVRACVRACACLCVCECVFACMCVPACKWCVYSIYACVCARASYPQVSLTPFSYPKTITTTSTEKSTNPVLTPTLSKIAAHLS